MASLMDSPSLLLLALSSELEEESEERLISSSSGAMVVDFVSMLYEQASLCLLLSKF